MQFRKIRSVHSCKSLRFQAAIDSVRREYQLSSLCDFTDVFGPLLPLGSSHFAKAQLRQSGHSRGRAACAFNPRSAVRTKRPHLAKSHVDWMLVVENACVRLLPTRSRSSYGTFSIGGQSMTKRFPWKSDYRKIPIPMRNALNGIDSDLLVVAATK